MANKALLDALTSDFGRDAKKEQEGSWMVYGKRRYLIARAHRNNVAFQKMVEDEMRPYQWALDRGNADAIKEVAQAVLQKVYANTILLAIESLPTKEGESGVSMDYTPADGVMLFEALPDFWDTVYRYAEAGRNYSRDLGYTNPDVKADSGN